MKGKEIQNICIIFLFMLGVVVTPADASFITVDDNQGGDYRTIQEAVDNAQNADTIIVSPGIYQENIKVDKELTILSHSTISGDQTGRTYVLGTVPENDVFDIYSSNVTIDGFYISGGSSEKAWHKAGISLEGVQNCSLRNNSLILNEVGIFLNRSQNNYLDSNFVVLESDGISLTDSAGNVLSNNLVVTNNQGISLNNSVNNTLAYNFISRNECGIRSHAAKSNTLINNSLYMNNIGVYLNESSNNTIYANEFTNFLNAVDEGNNIWNNSSTGNLWGDYSKKDTEGNGIGDSPYFINQTTGSTDYMPLAKETFSGNNSEGINSKDMSTKNALIALLNIKYFKSPQNNREKGVVVEATELGQINTALQKGPVFLKIGAEWCPVCRTMNPVIRELAAEYGDKATIISVDKDQSPRLETFFGIEYIPDSSVIVGIENGEYVYMKMDGNISKERYEARVIGVRNKEVFEKLLDLALLQKK
jgi:parallel beta-helix repeat protein